MTVATFLMVTVEEVAKATNFVTDTVDSQIVQQKLF